MLYTLPSISSSAAPKARQLEDRECSSTDGTTLEVNKEFFVGKKFQVAKMNENGSITLEEYELSWFQRLFVTFHQPDSW